MTGEATAPSRHTRGPSGRSADRHLSAPQMAILAAEAWSAHPATYTVVSPVAVTGIPRWAELVEAARTTLLRHEVFRWQPQFDATANITVTIGEDSCVAVEHVDLSAHSSGASDA